jgi:hypothetical protein
MSRPHPRVLLVTAYTAFVALIVAAANLGRLGGIMTFIPGRTFDQVAPLMSMLGILLIGRLARHLPVLHPAAA